MADVDEKGGWKQFQRLSFDGKKFSRRAKRAGTLTTKHAHKFVLKKLGSIRSVRQHIISWLVLIAVLITAVAVQSLWFQSGYKATAAVEGGTYAEGILGEIDTLNPLYAQTNAELSAARLLFSGLFDYDETGHLRENLAQNVTVSGDKKVYTITLRDGLRWHDGTALTADDVVFTVNLMKNPEVRAAMRGSWQDIRATVQDARTVVFTLPAPYASFPHALTFAVLPEHILGSVPSANLRENTFSISPVGSGPFTLRLLQPVDGRDTHKILHLSAWREYHRGAPRLDRFELHAYDKQDGIMRALKTGDINAAVDTGGRNSEVPGHFAVKDHAINNGVFALFNTQSSVLKDRRVRQALQKSTDTEKLRKLLTARVHALDLPFPEYQLENAVAPKKPALDQNTAHALLQKAGWKLSSDGQSRLKSKTPLMLRLVTVKDSQYEVVAKALAEQWRQLGIDVQLTVFDPAASNQSFAQAVLQPRQYDVLLNELVIGGDADVYAYWHSSQAHELGLNFSNYKSSLADDILSSARVRSERNLRAEKYRAFAEQWLRDAPAIALYQPVVEYAYTSNTRSMPDDIVLPSVADRYSNILYWTAERGSVYKSP